MKRLLLLVLAVILVGLAAGKAWAAPPAGDEAQGFVFFDTAIALGYEGIGYSYGAGFRAGDRLMLHVEGAPGGFAAGASFTAADDVIVIAEYQYVAGYVYDYWYGLEYIELEGFLAGVYYRSQGAGIWRGPYADKNVSLLGCGAIVASDGYETATGFFLESKGTFYIGENVAITSGLAYSGGILITRLGMMVEF